MSRRPVGRGWVGVFDLAVLIPMFLASTCGLAAAAETQVPLDSRGKIHRIDARLAHQLGLFTGDHSGFQEAKLFRLADSMFVLEITRRVDDATVRDRVPLDAAGADSLRTLVDARMTERLPSAQFNQEARPLLAGGSALIGFGFYGWAVPYMFDMEDEKNVAGIYLLTTAATMVLPSAITRQQDVTYPSVTLGFYGATRGAFHGALIAQAFAEDPEKAAVATAMATSVAEWIIGYRWGTGLSPGQAGAIGFGGDLGLGYGFGLAELIGDSEHREPLVLGMTALGIAGGWALGRNRDYSYGDVGIMRMASILGAYSGFALVVLDEDWEDETAIAVSMASAAIGTLAGDRIVNGKGYSFGQSISVGFATMSGALLAWGFAALAEPSDGYDHSGGVYACATALGAIGGYAAGIATQSPGGRPAQSSSLRLTLEPRWVVNHGETKMVPYAVMSLPLGPPKR